MTRIIARHVETLPADDATLFVFNLTFMHQTLADIVADRNRDVYVTIPNTVPIYSYYRYAVDEIVANFEDLWPSGGYVLPSDISIIGWRELQYIDRENYEIVDDFLGTSVTTGQIGQHGWDHSGTGYSVGTFSIASHPGVFRFNINTSGDGYLRSNITHYMNNLMEMNFIVRGTNHTGSYGGTLSNLGFEVGWLNPSVDSFCGWRIPGNATTNPPWTFVRRTNTSTYVQTVVSDMTFNAFHWYEMTWVRINDTQFRTRLVNLSTRTVSGTSVVFTPDLTEGMYINVRAASIAGVYRSLDVDYIRHVYGGATRIGV